MKIAKIVGREIFDSRGVPTVLCEMTLSNGALVSASVPSGASRGKHEAFELRDNEPRLMGKGVLKAIDNIEHIIAPALIGKEPDLVLIDELIREIDPSREKRKLGANATLAVSMATCRAQAIVENLSLYELIAQLYDADSISLPFPLLNVLNGGAHANNKFPIQEIMLAPIGAQNFRISFEAAVVVFYELKRLLNEKGKSTAVGDEGGFVAHFNKDTEPFDFLMQAIANTGNDGLFTIAIDVAANQLYDETTGKYSWLGKQKTTEQLLQFYKKLLDDYPLFSIEDGFAETDLDGWRMLYDELGGKLQIVGDDIFVTSVSAIANGIEQELANAAIIKPNQIGTITETLEAIAFCHQTNMNAIISHRSGDTNDTFIADLAVGTSAGQIKAGGCCRGERIAKYNRLMAIEDKLTMSLLDF